MLAALVMGAGCGTLDSQITYWSEPDPSDAEDPWMVFGGVAGDVRWMGRMVGRDRWSNPEVFLLAPMLAVDLPLSLAADVLALPMTLVQEVTN